MADYRNIFMNPNQEEAQPMDEQFRPPLGPTQVPQQAPPSTGETQSDYQRVLGTVPQIDTSLYQAGPAAQYYRSMIENQPTYGGYAPSMGRRLLASGAGLLTGTIDRMHGHPELAAQEQGGIQQNILSSPYRRAAALYNPEVAKAGELAQMEQGSQAVGRQLPINEAKLRQAALTAERQYQQGQYYQNRSNEYRPQSLEEKLQLERAAHPIRPGANPITLDRQGRVAITRDENGNLVFNPYGQTPGIQPPTPQKPYVSPLDVENQRYQHNKELQGGRLSAAASRQQASINARKTATKTPKTATPAMQAQAEELANRRLASTNPEFAKYVKVDPKTHKAGVAPPQKSGVLSYFGGGQIDPKEQENYNALLKQRDSLRDQILGGGQAPAKNYSIVMPGQRPVSAPGAPSASGYSPEVDQLDEGDEEDPYELQQEEEDEKE